jgi:hypothetical protein
VQLQPVLCPVCGTELCQLANLSTHLVVAHQLESPSRRQVLLVAWREASCAVLGILNPEWSGP